MPWVRSANRVGIRARGALRAIRSVGGAEKCRKRAGDAGYTRQLFDKSARASAWLGVFASRAWRANVGRALWAETCAIDIRPARAGRALLSRRGARGVEIIAVAASLARSSIGFSCHWVICARPTRNAIVDVLQTRLQAIGAGGAVGAVFKLRST